MDLKKFLPGKEATTSEYYWTLLIEPGWVQAGIWKIEGDNAQVAYLGPPSAWELDEELVNASDSALASAIQDFPEGEADPTKTVFGVSSSWVEGGEIKLEFLDKIKKVCTELSLKPVGFVVLAEAIAHFIKSEEGSALSAIVVGVYKENLEISVFRQGTLLGSTLVARSVSIADDVVEGLVRFSLNDYIFSRFLIYDGKEGEIEEVQQNLLKVNWEDYEKVKFLHTPKIEIIEPNKKISAIALAGASEIASIKKIVSLVEEDEESEPETEAQPGNESGVGADEMGFVMEKDITQEDEVIETPTTFEPEKVREMQNIEPVDQESNFDTPPIKSQKRLGSLGNVKIASIFKNILSPISKLKPKLAIFKSGEKAFVFGSIFFILLIGVAFFLWWYIPHAEISIFVAPKKQTEKINIKVSESVDSSNFPEKTLKGEKLTTSVEGDKTKSTTGTKTVGDKAKGEITIYRVGTKLTLSSGTKVQGPNNLNFTLDNSVEVASGSASTPGITKTSVSAENIGPEFNLASGNSFTIGNYSTSDIEAKNESSFSGGTSREVSSVSEDDQKTLRTELEEELSQKAKQELRENLNEGEILIEESLEIDTKTQSYSDKVGDEAESLKLSLELEATAYSIDKKEVLELSRESLKDKVPQGFILRDEQIDIQFDFLDKDDEEYEFEVSIDANLLPEIKLEEVAKKLRGKYPTLAKEYMTKEIPGFVRAEIRISPTLPGRLNTLPRVTKNIEVTVSAEK